VTHDTTVTPIRIPSMLLCL